MKVELCRIKRCSGGVDAQNSKHVVGGIENQRKAENRPCIPRLNRQLFREQQSQEQDRYCHEKTGNRAGYSDIEKVLATPDWRLDTDKSAESPNERRSRNEIWKRCINAAT